MKVGNLNVTTYVTCGGARRSKIWPTSVRPEHRVDIENPTTINYRVAIRCHTPDVNPRLAYFVDGAFTRTWHTRPVWIGGRTTRPEAQAIGRTPASPGQTEFRCHTVEIMHKHGAPKDHHVIISVMVTAK